MKHFKQKNKAESVRFFLLITNQDAIFAHSPPLKTAQSHNCSILITSKFNNSVTKKVETTIQYLVSAHPHPNHNRFQPGKYPKTRTKTREFADAVTESRSARSGGRSARSGGCRLSPSQLPSPEILPSPAAKIYVEGSQRNWAGGVRGGEWSAGIGCWIQTMGGGWTGTYVYRRRGGWCGPFLPFFLYFFYFFQLGRLRCVCFLKKKNKKLIIIIRRVEWF